MVTKIIKVSESIGHLSDWKEFDDQLPSTCIIDKQICSCGATVYYLSIPKPVIVAEPRKSVIQSKLDDVHCQMYGKPFYYDRSGKDDVDVTNNALENYIYSSGIGCPYKILVTFDSLKLLTDYLDRKGWLSWFTIVVDEFQCIIGDVKMKGDTELKMVRNLYQLNNHIRYISASIHKEEHLDMIPEFRCIPMVRLDWGPQRITKPTVETIEMKSTKEEIVRIIDAFRRVGYFKNPVCVNNQWLYSREAVFYINNPKTIVSIIRDCKLTPQDTLVVCADKPENEKMLRDVGFKIGRFASETNYKTENRTFTFVTRASFEGADHYSDTSSSFVFSDSNVDCLSIDIVLDLPQIAARTRTKWNPFRNHITLYYKTSHEQRIAELQQAISHRYDRTNHLLKCLCDQHDKYTLEQLVKAQRIERYTENYIDLVDTGINSADLIGNNMAYVNDLRAYEILSEQYKSGFNVSVFLEREGNELASSHVEFTRKDAFITEFLKDKNFPRRMELLAKTLNRFPEMRDDLMASSFIGLEFKEIVQLLPLERIKALQFKRSALEAEISVIISKPLIAKRLTEIISPGGVYSNAQVKEIMTMVYQEFGIKKAAKAVDLQNYMPNLKQRSFTGADGRRYEGFEILSI